MNALGAGQDEVAKPAHGQPETLALFLEPWRELYERRQRGVSPRALEEVIGHASDAWTHDLPRLSELADTDVGTSPIPEDGSACENESPEAATGGKQ
jgi:hypothetical protein